MKQKKHRVVKGNNLWKYVRSVIRHGVKVTYTTFKQFKRNEHETS